MKFKLAALPLMVFAASASAETYQSISEVDYISTEIANTDVDHLSLDTSYYFAPLETRGPLKEFDYIIKSSRLGATYDYTDTEFGDADVLGVGGEYFAANGFMVGGAYEDSDGADKHTLSAGYLFTPSFLASVEREKYEGADAVYYANLRYNHELGGNDYVGFNFRADDEFDTRSLSSKLLKELPGQTWLALTGEYTNVDEGENSWDLGAEYYFSKESSVNVGYDKEETLAVGVSHFFNRNVAGKLSYATNSDTDVDAFLLGLTVQL